AQTDGRHLDAALAQLTFGHGFSLARTIVAIVVGGWGWRQAAAWLPGPGVAEAVAKGRQLIAMQNCGVLGRSASSSRNPPQSRPVVGQKAYSVRWKRQCFSGTPSSSFYDAVATHRHADIMGRVGVMLVSERS